MNHFEWLQFFADGGAAEGGEGGAANGVATGDPGRSLEELGVPSTIAERHRSRVKSREPAAQTEPEAQPAEEKAAEPEAQAEEKNTAVTWDEFMKIPENNERMQQIMSERLKKQGRENEDYMSKLAPMLELLAGKYGIKPDGKGRFDPEKLAKAVTDDNAFYEERALEMGVDTETAKHIATLEAEVSRNNAERAQAEAQARADAEARAREAELRQHFMKMQVQAKALKEIFPDFDLARELQDPDFMRRTSPEVGMSVEDAFYSLHHGQIMEKQAADIARRAKQEVADSIRSGRNHPRENGGSSAAAAVGVPDFARMSPAERLAFIKRARPPR